MFAAEGALAFALRALALASWFGGGIATMLATSAVFARAESRKVAGDFAGAILRRTNLLRGAAAGPWMSRGSHPPSPSPRCARRGGASCNHG